jgi:hypothetical protein
MRLARPPSQDERRYAELAETLPILQAEGVDGAFVYEFVAPESLGTEKVIPRRRQLLRQPPAAQSVPVS